jgi:hypothetical protein
LAANLNREIMQRSDYRNEYVSCEKYPESTHSPSNVDLQTAFTEVSTQPAFLMMKVKTFSGFIEFCLLELGKIRG